MGNWYSASFSRLFAITSHKKTDRPASSSHFTTGRDASQDTPKLAKFALVQCHQKPTPADDGAAQSVRNQPDFSARSGKPTRIGKHASCKTIRIHRKSLLCIMKRRCCRCEKVARDPYDQFLTPT